jgi:hypothetical protein
MFCEKCAKGRIRKYAKYQQCMGTSLGLRLLKQHPPTVSLLWFPELRGGLYKGKDWAKGPVASVDCWSSNTSISRIFHLYKTHVRILIIYNRLANILCLHNIAIEIYKSFVVDLIHLYLIRNKLGSTLRSNFSKILFSLMTYFSIFQFFPYLE